jgi:hypothetical protein
MAYDCRIPLFRRQWEHHILVGPPDPPFGVGGHSHVQLRSTVLAWLYRSLCDGGVEEWSELHPWRVRIPPTDLVVGAFFGR